MAGRITAVKGIRIEYEPNEDAIKLLKRYTTMVQEFLDIAYENNITRTHHRGVRDVGVSLSKAHWHSVVCPSCNLVENRHRIACLNIAKRAIEIEDEGMRFVPDWGAMQLKLTLSPQVGLG